MRRAVNGVSITAEGVLLAQKGAVWILPGGKPEPGENDFDCLTREMKEEFPGVAIVGEPKYVCQVVGKTPYTGDQLTAEIYLIDIEGDISPGAEIRSSCRTKVPSRLYLSDITRMAILALQRNGHL